jgi:putative ABC transport system permease protein
MTSLLAIKLGRDLRAIWPRLAMMAVAIAVSLTVFSAVLYAWSTISRETERAYLSTDPASATILLDRGVDAERMKAIAAEARTRPRVLEATGRTQFTSEVRAGGREQDNELQVFVAAPDEPLRMARFEVRPGRWPPARDEILLGADSLELFAWRSATLLLSRRQAANPRGCASRALCTTRAWRPQSKSRSDVAISRRQRWPGLEPSRSSIS